MNGPDWQRFYDEQDPEPKSGEWVLPVYVVLVLFSLCLAGWWLFFS